MYPRQSGKKFYFATDREERVFGLAQKHPELVAELVGAELTNRSEADALERLAEGQRNLDNELLIQIEHEDSSDEDDSEIAMAQAGGIV
jgi:hypothetical protein